MGNDIGDEESSEPTTARGVHLNPDGTPNYGEKKTWEEGTQNLSTRGYLKSKEGKNRTIHSAINMAINLIALIPLIGGAASGAASTAKGAQAASTGVKAAQAAKGAQAAQAASTAAKGAQAAQAAKGAQAAAQTAQAAQGAQAASQAAQAAKAVDAAADGKKAIDAAQAVQAAKAANAAHTASGAANVAKGAQALDAASDGKKVIEGAKAADAALDAKTAAQAAKGAKEASAGTKLVDAGVEGAKSLKGTEAAKKAEELAKTALDSDIGKKATDAGRNAYNKLSPESKEQLNKLYQDKKALALEKGKKAASKKVDDEIRKLKDNSSAGTKSFDNKEDLANYLKTSMLEQDGNLPQASGKGVPVSGGGAGGLSGAGDGADSDSSSESTVVTDKKGNAIGSASFSESFKKQGWDDNRSLAQRAVDGTRDSTGIDLIDAVGMIPLIGGAAEWKLDRELKRYESVKFAIKSKAATASLVVIALLFSLISISGIGGGAASINAAGSSMKGSPTLLGGCYNDTPNISDTGSNNPSVGQTDAVLNDEQKKNAQIIINTSYGYEKVSANKKAAATISVMTAMQESSLVNIKHGDWAGPDSTGLFQQRDSWGPASVRQDPEGATKLFLDALVAVSEWEKMEYNDAAQTVQRSAHPSAYGKWRSLADTLVKDLAPKDSPVGNANSDTFTGNTSRPDSYKPDSSDPIWSQDLTSDLRAVYVAVKSKWPDAIRDYGANGGGMDHATGMALDTMIPDYKSPTGRKLGWDIAYYFEQNADRYGINYLIYANKIWTSGGVWRAYDGGGVYGPGELNDTTLHYDHVHISVFGNKGDLSISEKNGSGDSTDGGGGATSNDECAPGSSTNQDGVATSGENDYPYKNPLNTCAWCSDVDEGGNADPWGLYKRECVSFVAWRMNQQMGWKEGQDHPFTMAKMGLSGRGNAQYWKDGLVDRGYKFDKSPSPGAIAWWASNGGTGIGEAGHVAVVKEVIGEGKVLIEQYNAHPEEWGYSVQEIDVNYPTGYIHVADTSGDSD